MFYGHLGIALAAKPLAPKNTLGVLLVAASAADILCGAFTAFGIEGIDANAAVSIPLSHGLFMSIVLSFAAMALAFLISRNTKMSIVIGLLVLSHWILDFISHPMGMGKVIPKDLPLFFGDSPKVGLGLYNSAAAAIVTEFGLLAMGISIYLIKTKAVDRTGKWSFILFLFFIFLFPLSMLLPSHLLYLSTLVLIFLLPIGIFIDRHRKYIYKQ